MDLNFKTRLLLIDKSLDFVDAFKAFLPDLKRCGSNWRCKSPFQKEKTPSFFVNPRKKVWHDFSSGAGGKNLVSFVMQSHNLSFRDALNLIETRFGLKRKNYSKSLMLNVVDILNRKPEEYEQNKLNKIYEDNLNKLLWKFRKQANDNWQILNPIIEYIWQEFDDTSIDSLMEFKLFAIWAYSILKYFRQTTIKYLHETIKIH